MLWLYRPGKGPGISAIDTSPDGESGVEDTLISYGVSMGARRRQQSPPSSVPPSTEISLLNFRYSGVTIKKYVKLYKMHRF